MKNELYKISEDVAKSLASYFASEAFQKQFATVKDSAGADTGTFRMVISTDQVDRHGEIVNQDGWQYDNYMKNAVVLWGHDSYSIPVGITDKLSMVVENGVKSLVAEGRFAAHEFAQTLRKLYEDGMLRASSVGFIPLEYDGNTITKAELLEWSFVSIPANPFALSARGYDVSTLISKGVIKDTEEVKEGEEVVTPKEDETTEEENTEEVATPENEQVAYVAVEGEEVQLTFADGSVKSFKCATSFKAGRVLSKANRGKIEAAYSALEEVLAADSDTTEAENAQPADTTKTAEEKEANDFLVLRRGVQGIFGELQNVLVDAKKRAEAKGIQVR